MNKGYLIAGILFVLSALWAYDSYLTNLYIRTLPYSLSLYIPTLDLISGLIFLTLGLRKTKHKN